MTHSILWRGFYLTGHEYCRINFEGGRWFVSGVAVFKHEEQPCRLEYLVECDSLWKTDAARVSGWVSDELIDVEIAVAADHRWWLNGVEQPQVAECIDVDLNFSPSTNLLPIRRLNLEVGQESEVRAAWLRFPSFKLEPLVQVYRRLDENTYRYESGDGAFVSDLKVNSFGLVTSYPGIWEEEA